MSNVRSISVVDFNPTAAYIAIYNNDVEKFINVSHIKRPFSFPFLTRNSSMKMWKLMTINMADSFSKFTLKNIWFQR